MLLLGMLCLRACSHGRRLSTRRTAQAAVDLAMLKLNTPQLARTTVAIRSNRRGATAPRRGYACYFYPSSIFKSTPTSNGEGMGRK
jgi:hypothetical protein